MDNVTQQETGESTKAGKKRGRGPAKSIKTSEPMVLEYDETHFPTVAFSKEYGQHIGHCASKLDINIRKWADVEERVKDVLWTETKKKFHVEDDAEGKRKKNFLRALAARFRRRKSWLVSRFITKTTGPSASSEDAHKQPWEVCEGHFTQAQWEQFEEYARSDEFQRISQAGKANAERNIHRHTLGQKSYLRKRVDWIEEKRLSASIHEGTSDDAGSDVTSETSISFQNRSLEWCLAHQKKSSDGEWVVKNPETARIVDRVMEHIEKEREEGGTPSVSNRGEDALTIALGKKDHRGYVKGLGRFGVGVGHQIAFGKSSGPRRRSAGNSEEVEALKATIAQLEESFDKRMEEKLEQKLEEKCKAMQEEMAKQFAQQLALLQNPIKQPPSQKEAINCRLAVLDSDNGGNLVVVALGRVHPDLTGAVHNTLALPGHYRVSLDSPSEDHMNVPVPVPLHEADVRTVGEAKDCFLQWPIELVLFEDNVPLLKMKPQWSLNRERVSSCDPRIEADSGETNQDVLVDGDDGEEVGESCELLRTVMKDEQHDTVMVPLKAPLFYFDSDRDIMVSSLDISEFLERDCANISLIHVYILFLAEVIIPKLLKGQRISFLCPQHIAGSECKRIFKDSLGYVKSAFCSEVQSTSVEHSKYVLAPYNENAHWILLVVDLRIGTVYQFDPLRPPAGKRRTLEVDKILMFAYRSYRAKLGGSALRNSPKNLVFRQMECAQQTGSTRCCYYVMRDIHDIITSYGGRNTDLQKDYIGRTAAYSDEEIDFVRDQWADYFRTKFLIS